DIEIETMKSTIQSYEKKLAEVKATLPKNEEQEIDADSKRIMDMVTSMEVTKILEQIAALEQQRDLVKEENADALDQDLVKKRVTEIDGQIAGLRKQINNRMGINASGPKKNVENRDLANSLNNKISDSRMQLQSMEVRRNALVNGIGEN